MKSVINIGYRILCYFRNRVFPSKHERMVARWFKDSGDTKLRLAYNLDKDSIVFDLGGYKGQWASDIFSRYCCKIYVFEPVTEFAQCIKERFRQNDKIQVYDFGLSSLNTSIKIYLAGDGSSIFGKCGKPVEGKLHSAFSFIYDNQINKIDLMKINIEGGEYELLEHLINTKLIGKIQNMQIQFHDFVTDAEKRMHKIQEQLAYTHELTYQYPFVWENWKLK